MSKTNQLVGFTQQIPGSGVSTPESLQIKRVFDKATQTIVDLFIHMQETSSIVWDSDFYMNIK